MEVDHICDDDIKRWA